MLALHTNAPVFDILQESMEQKAISEDMEAFCTHFSLGGVGKNLFLFGLRNLDDLQRLDRNAITVIANEGLLKPPMAGKLFDIIQANGVASFGVLHSRLKLIETSVTDTSTLCISFRELLPVAHYIKQLDISAAYIQRVCDATCAAMQRHLSDEELLVAACHVLGSFSCEEPSQAVETVVSTLHAWQDAANVQGSGFSALVNISGGGERARASIAGNRRLWEVVRATRFTSSESIMASVAGVLVNLSLYSASRSVVQQHKWLRRFMEDVKGLHPRTVNANIVVHMRAEKFLDLTKK